MHAIAVFAAPSRVSRAAGRSEGAAVPVDESDMREQVARLESLLATLESLEDPVARAAATETVQGVVSLYGEALARIMEHVMTSSAPGLVEALAGDALIAHVLMLHGLHPVDVETRVARALDEVRPYLASHGGNVELVGVGDGVARLRLEGSCHGCRSSADTLRLAVEEAVLRAAPDIDRIEADGAVAPEPAFVPVTALRRRT
ncbi:MAG TPA: NifU family protein [Gemmatimonadaceae bacterium]|nr:NifU family protein [Gemmatimonadaceae bacterium]